MDARMKADRLTQVLEYVVRTVRIYKLDRSISDKFTQQMLLHAGYTATTGDTRYYNIIIQAEFGGS
jgi:hypothetical protein